MNSPLSADKCLNRLGEDGDGPECGDEGRMCDECQTREAAQWNWLSNVSKWAVMPPDEDYYQELRDAGRI